jgi:hypothetical protein
MGGGSRRRRACSDMIRSSSPAASVLPRLAWLLLTGGTWWAGPAGAAMLLSDRQLDVVTAGSATVNLDLTAAAQGETASATTTGSIRSADTTVLLIDLRPTASGVVVPHLLGRIPVGIVLASGDAAASGTTGAQCSATVEPSGDFVFLTEAALKTVASAPPIAVNCACAAFGITLGPH